VTKAEREHPRYAHEAAVTVRVNGKTLGGRTHNVSRGGMCANLPEPLAAGSEIDLDLQLVFEEDAQSEPLRLPARVAWCTPFDDQFQIGLSFRPMDGEQSELFTIFMRLLDDQEREKPVRMRDQDVDERFG
jgi:Tfp pilus assembly protein PilZ